MAESFGTELIETSAKMNTNVTQVFHELVRKVMKWREEHPEKMPKSRKRRGCTII